VLTLSSLSCRRFSLFCIGVWIGCSTPSTPPLPESTLEMESWLQTSRKVRYPFDVNTKWEGWILHSPRSVQIGIAHFQFETLPNSEQWHDCIRSQQQPPTLWLSATLKTLDDTKLYASYLNDNLPIIKVDC